METCVEDGLEVDREELVSVALLAHPVTAPNRG